jgi:hypothetical protein
VKPGSKTKFGKSEIPRFIDKTNFFLDTVAFVGQSSSKNTRKMD